jgi:hypothetical protein
MVLYYFCFNKFLICESATHTPVKKLKKLTHWGTSPGLPYVLVERPTRLLLKREVTIEPKVPTSAIIQHQFAIIDTKPIDSK